MYIVYIYEFIIKNDMKLLKSKEEKPHPDIIKFIDNKNVYIVINTSNNHFVSNIFFVYLYYKYLYVYL